ncbi:MAG: 1-deoxy-D-xylulose-5-phosphate synthase, partial [Mycobacterium sp.]|nr:1-deoxy-D-xylulose-5-phosphate synthase [Mycobacterium sp.]
HQAYAHKLLTGRAEMFTALRQAGGLSGYLSRVESPHDWLENSHASVSLSWADGIVKALALQGRHDRRIVAVIGDGALTGGVAWEGLNNLGGTNRPVIVVLNDNSRSYDPTTGAIAAHLHQLRHRSPARDNLFKALGFAYVGPVDGHDIDATCTALRHAAALSKPVIVHAVTAKGRGFAPAEADDNDRMHACGVVDPVTGRPTKPSPPSWTDLFEHEIVRIAEQRPDVVAMTAAMRRPTGLGRFSERHPQRVFDSGIAEQHLLASAAGLATAGTHPVVCLYSTFLHRGFDQLLLDIGLHELPVTLVLDRAGITGPDGPSHHGIWDLALMTSVPGLCIACPRDPQRLSRQLNEAVNTATRPTALRYPKGCPGPNIPTIDHIDGLDILHTAPHHPPDVLLVAIGAMAHACMQAAKELNDRHIGVTVVDPQWVWPLNPALTNLAVQHRLTVCVEDGIANAGIGARFTHHINQTHPRTHTHTIGLPTAYIPHANRNHILAQHQLTGPTIATTCQLLLNVNPRTPGTHDASHQLHHR